VPRGDKDHRALMMSLILTWFIGCASLTWEARKQTWFVFLLGIVLTGLRPTTARSESA
jgi:hypothetical protein